MLSFWFISIVKVSAQIEDTKGFVPSTSIIKGKRVALLIGNADYAEQANLGNNPRNDANDLRAVLKDLKFDVLVETDLKKSKMKKSVRRFLKESKDAEVALFYYSGHGMQSESILPISYNHNSHL